MDQELECQYLCKVVHSTVKIALILKHMISIGGKEFTEETIDKVLSLCENDQIEGLSILGGEPMNPQNIEGTTKLAKAFKEKFPNKSLWAWSGYTFDTYLKDKEIANFLDVVVDGTFDETVKNPTLEWKGSANQRVIDVKESLKSDEIVFFKNKK